MSAQKSKLYSISDRLASDAAARIQHDLNYEHLQLDAALLNRYQEMVVKIVSCIHCLTDRNELDD